MATSIGTDGARADEHAGDEAQALHGLPPGAKNYITPAGLARLQAELHRLLRVERPVVVEDGPCAAPDQRISGSLADLVSLMVVPLVGGVPSPIRGRGRAALSLVAQRRVKVEGRLALMRKFLSIIRV